VRRAASVRSEPGSNSQKKFIFQGPPFQYTWSTVPSSYSIFKDLFLEANLDYMKTLYRCQIENHKTKNIFYGCQITELEGKENSY
ncbi:MAG: hypothetical protein AB7T38_17370, partial [Nitrospirales bacterium]